LDSVVKARQHKVTVTRLAQPNSARCKLLFDIMGQACTPRLPGAEEHLAQWGNFALGATGCTERVAGNCSEACSRTKCATCGIDTCCGACCETVFGPSIIELSGDNATHNSMPTLVLRNAFSALHHGEDNYDLGPYSARSCNSESSSEDFGLASPPTATKGRRPPGVPPLAISALFKNNSETAVGALSSKSTGTGTWTGTGSGSANYCAPNFSFRSPLSPTPRRLSKLSPPAIQKVPVLLGEPVPADPAEEEACPFPSSELRAEEDFDKVPEPADEFTSRDPPFSDRRAISARVALSARMGGA